MDSQRLNAIIEYFDKAYPLAVTELNYENPYQLLIAVMLSAQCTDKRVNLITPALFARFPNAFELASSDFETVFSYIKSISYPNNKSKHLLATARILVDRFEGNVPMTHQELIDLPGVGRKTANVILSVLKNELVMPVDTHVFRLSNRIGFSNAKTVLGVEKQLVALLPATLLPKAHHWLILHGRRVCKAKNPECVSCGLVQYCDYFLKQNT